MPQSCWQAVEKYAMSARYKSLDFQSCQVPLQQTGLRFLDVGFLTHTHHLFQEILIHVSACRFGILSFHSISDHVAKQVPLRTDVEKAVEAPILKFHSQLEITLQKKGSNHLHLCNFLRLQKQGGLPAVCQHSQKILSCPARSFEHRVDVHVIQTIQEMDEKSQDNFALPAFPNKVNKFLSLER